jgi:hypothetical protein
MHPARRFDQPLSPRKRPRGTQQLELLDPLLAQDLDGARDRPVPEDNRSPGVAPDEIPAQLNPGL